MDDLKTIDTYTWQLLISMRKNAKKIKSDEEFEAIVDQNFVVNMNGKDIELCENGKEIMVNKQNMEEFISLLCEKRFSEGLQ
jgi:HECT-domain (ubiquitin-transferase)